MSDASVLLRFVADPPTTTMQRLKGILTGGLPTFIDIGSSFAASAVQEDNLIDQLRAAGKRLRFVGDDTWMQLFPSQFDVAQPYPSFNVQDLHTVDDGVWKHLVPALEAPEDWDVLIGHYLGVDHAGHTFDVNSQHMVEKLQQMDQQISQVLEMLSRAAGPGGQHEGTLLGWIASYVKALQSNAWQVQRYLNTYAAEGASLPRAELAATNALFDELWDDRGGAPMLTQPQQLQRQLARLVQYLEAAAALAREQWTQRFCCHNRLEALAMAAVLFYAAGIFSIGFLFSEGWMLCYMLTGLTVALAASILFFCSGHFREFAGLQYTAGFAGVADFNMWQSGLLLALNTFGGPILAACALPIVASIKQMPAAKEY
ncbi:hypothetical protein WJX72_003633 [[Myrmecia] bisecta]|uniref:GPI ethanolamine phosphate transferase 3 n=1 Tax=[Myrmecia] bisecta TaxID=41462 RepID=A0AAW1R5Y0_9CHLO